MPSGCVPEFVRRRQAARRRSGVALQPLYL